MRKKFIFTSVCPLFILTLSIFLFASCENPIWENSVGEFFEYYTESAAIEEHIISASIGTGNTGIDFVESDESKTVTFYLRNPKKYNLDFSYTFDDSLIAEKAATISNSVRFLQAADKQVVSLTFSKAFLQSIDNGDVSPATASGDETVIKNLSGRVSVKEASTQREFESYDLSLMVNSMPPKLQGAMFQRDKAQNEEGTQYIICFNIPDLYGTVHAKDTKKLYIGNELYNIDFTGNGSVSITRPDNGEVKLGTTRPSGLKNVNSTTTIFTALSPAADKYIPLYYQTGLNPDDVANSKVSSTITLADDFGFSKSNTVYSQVDQLKPVTLNVIASPEEQYRVSEESGTYQLKILHDRKAIHYTDEQNVQEEITSPSSPVIEYTVYKINESGSGVEYARGSKTAPVTIPVEKGKYYVKAFATCTGFIDSCLYEGFASKADNTVPIYKNENYYVNANSIEGNGSKNKPYSSIQNCLNEIYKDAQENYINSGYVINLMSDISPAEEDVFNDSNKHSLLYFNKPSEITESGNIKFTINGNGHKIDAERSGTTGNEGRVIDVCANVDLTINNAVITGGNMPNGAGVFMEDGNVTLENGTNLTGNVARDRGGAFYIDNGTLNLYGSTISGNTAEIDGGGIFYKDGTINVKNKNVVDLNTNADGTKNLNLYILPAKKINIAGHVTDSKIRVIKAFDPDSGKPVPDVGKPVVLTEGYNYNSATPAYEWNNTDMPGRVFKNDAQGNNAYPIIEDGGEAVFVKAGAGIHTAYDFTFDLAIDRASANGNHEFYVGHKKTFTVTPTVKLGNTTLTYVEANQTLRNDSTKYYDINGNEEKIKWSARIYCGRELDKPSVNKNQITIPATLPYPDTFRLQITAEYMGVEHTKDFTIYGVEGPAAVSSTSALMSAITNTNENSITLLATGTINVSDNSLNIPAGKTVTLIRSDDIPSYQYMLQISDGKIIGEPGCGTLVLDGDNASGSCSLVYGVSCSIYNVTFKNYTNKNGNGAAFTHNCDGYANLYDCTFENCHARNGGALNMQGEVWNGNTQDMTGTNGIVRCHFKNCTASGKGGAIYIHPWDRAAGRAKILGCTFTNCNAASGKSIYAKPEGYSLFVYYSTTDTCPSQPTTGQLYSGSSPFIVD